VGTRNRRGDTAGQARWQRKGHPTVQCPTANYPKFHLHFVGVVRCLAPAICSLSRIGVPNPSQLDGKLTPCVIFIMFITALPSSCMARKVPLQLRRLSA